MSVNFTRLAAIITVVANSYNPNQLGIIQRALNLDINVDFISY